MEKKEIIGISVALITMLSSNLISAFGLSDALNMIGESDAIIITAFVVSFALIFLVLNRFFKKINPYTGEEENNRVVPGVIAVSLAFLIAYGINKTNIGFGSLEGFGIGEDMFYMVISIAVIVSAIILLWKLKTHSLWVAGALLAIAGILKRGGDFKLIVIGIGLIFLYALLFSKRGRRNEESEDRRKEAIISEIDEKRRELAQQYAKYKEYVKFIRMTKANRRVMSTREGRERVRRYGRIAREKYNQILQKEEEIKNLQRRL